MKKEWWGDSSTWIGLFWFFLFTLTLEQVGWPACTNVWERWSHEIVRLILMKAFSKISKAPLLIWMPDGLSYPYQSWCKSQLSVPLNGILTRRMHIKLVVYSFGSYSVWKLYAFCCWPLEVFPTENLANYDWWTKPRREQVKQFSFSTSLL